MVPWRSILRKSERLFQYMLEHDLIHDNKMDHFQVYHVNRPAGNNDRQFQESYGAEIEPLFVAWIQEEDRQGRLRDRSLWQPMRDDRQEGSEAIMGYHRLFSFIPTHPPCHYKPCHTGYGPEEHPLPDGTIPRLTKIHFRLALVSDCARSGYYEDCSTCLIDATSILDPHFVAGVYGWEEDDTPYLKPDCYPCYSGYYGTRIVDSNIIPDKEWNAEPEEEGVWDRGSSEDED
jgi:hypothetical protein